MGEVTGSKQIRFGTDGWRGIIADDFTFANVRDVTRAIAYYLRTAYSPDRPVLVGYDTRFLADKFAEAAADVLAGLGWTVKIAERDCPTPVIAYNARYLQSAGALMFTASHNPPGYCGLKYIPDYAGPATTPITDAIVAYLKLPPDVGPCRTSVGTISTFDPKPAYLSFITQLLDVERIRQAGLKVIYDALYSTSRGYLDEMLRYCGCELETFNMYRDVLFGGGMPEPKGQQLAGLVDAVQRSHANVGVATDGDGDRFGIVDEQGNILTPNAVLLVLAQHLIKNKGRMGAIVRTVATTRLLDNFAALYGLPIYETPVGFKYIGAKMRELPVLIGGEESGGLSVIGHIPEKDGILANLLVVEAIAYEGKSLSHLVQDVIDKTQGPLYNHRTDLRLSDEHKAAVLHTFTHNTPAHVAGLKVTAIGYKDGIKLYLEDDSWVLLRPSGTEPLMRVYLETNTPTKMTDIAADMEQLIQRIQWTSV